VQIVWEEKKLTSFVGVLRSLILTSPLLFLSNSQSKEKILVETVNLGDKMLFIVS
jgi:hypothetical protein